MKSGQIKQITSKAIEELIAALKSDHSEALTNYLAAVAKFRKYSLYNVLLIARACPQATNVAGYQTWRSLGRYVKKGEKGIMILAPILPPRSEASDERISDELRPAVGFRSVYVFDVTQTDGTPLPGIGCVSGDPGGYREQLEKFIREQGISLEYSTSIAPAKGISEGGKITVLPGQTPAETVATLAHEIAHEMLHRADRRASTTKRIRETEAEAVAFIVCQAIGLESGAASANYISLWDGDVAVLLASLELVQRTAIEIIAAITLEKSLRPEGGG